MSVAVKAIAEDLGWSIDQKGLILSSFYWGYTIGQIPAAKFAQLYGHKHIFGMSILLPSILTLFIPAACRFSFPLALFLRSIIGLLESACFPSAYFFFPHWIPFDERTILVPFVLSGMYFGEIVGFSLSGTFVESTLVVSGADIGGWPSVFYVFGSVGILWFPFWFFWAYESPEKHPSITREELTLIRRGKAYAALQPDSQEARKEEDLVKVHSFRLSALHDDDQDRALSGDSDRSSGYFSYNYRSDSHGNNSVPSASPMASLILSQSADQSDSRTASLMSEEIEKETLARGTPWKAFFTHPAALALLANNFTYGWVGFTLLSELPTYLTEVLGFDLSSAGILCVFPYLALLIATVFFSRVFESLENDYKWKVRSVRQCAQQIAFGGVAIGIAAAGFIESRYLAYGCMIVVQFSLGAVHSGLSCAFNDVSPNYSSVLFTIGNTLGACAGIIGPIIVSACTESLEEDNWGWRLVFLLTSGLCVLSLALWAAFQTSDIVPSLNNPALH
eukprot:gene26696-35372_t